MLGAGSPVIANVMHGEHFVLVVGWSHDGDTLFVNDPGFNRASYSFKQDVMGWRLFRMSSSSKKLPPPLPRCAAAALSLSLLSLICL